MASAARGESSNPYGGGLGIGGKFRKPPARRSQKTPYDRPPTSVRKPVLGDGENRGGGWLSKLVDPAQRLITYSAHRLFASVFRKRIASGETPLQWPEQQNQLPERDVIPETNIGHTEDTSGLSMKNDVTQVDDTNAFVDPGNNGFTDLEKILRQKTFTRSEVDRLTTLLRSKTTDSSTVVREQENEVNIARHPPSHEGGMPQLQNGSMNALVSTPLRSSRALDECTDSPAQLAKAYMGSRPSEVTPSMLGLRGQAVREDSVFLNRTPCLPKSPTMSLVPKSFGQRPQEIGFITPRSRGRSATYSMARTPYSRPQSNAKIGPLFQASPSTWEKNLSLGGSRQGFQSGLKRKSSVLESDIGSVGSVRSTRQKSNLSSKILALPASESPFFVRASGGQKSTHTSKEIAEDIPGSSFNLVPSKSREMASKILQQLDILSKDKSPSKLSPSMLRGPALKSLQNVEAPKFLDNLSEKKPDSSYQKQNKSIKSGSREVMALSEKTNGAVGNTSKTDSSIDQETRAEGAYLPLTNSLEQHPQNKTAFRMNVHDDEDLFEMDNYRGVASTPYEVSERENAVKVAKGAGISMPKWEKPLTSSEVMPSTPYFSNGEAPQETSNGSLETGSSKFTTIPIEALQKSTMASEPISKSIQGTEKASISPVKLTSEEKVISLEDPKRAATVFSNIIPSPAATYSVKQNTGASADIKLEKISSSSFGVSEASAKPTESMKTISNSASGAGPTTSAASTLNGDIFSAGANVFSSPLNNGSLGSVPSFPSSISKLPANTSNDNNSQSTSPPPFSSASPFKFGEPVAQFSVSTVSASSGPISTETEVKNSTFGNVNSFKFGGMASADTSTDNAFPTKSSEIKTTPSFVFGSSSSTVVDAANSTFGGTPSVFGANTLNPSTAASSAPGSSGSLMFGVASSSTPGTEISKFSSIPAATATATGSNIFGTSSPAFASSGSSLFGGVAASTASNVFGTSSPAFASSGSSMFGGTAASTASNVFGFNAASSAPAGSSQSQASNLFGAANAPTDNAGSGTTTPNQSVPFKFDSSAPAPSFSFSGNTSLASNSSPFGLTKSEPAVLAFGSTSQLSSTNSSASSSLFGTNWQAPNSAPVFSSSFSTSSFGGSSTFTGSNTSAPVFGASTNTPSSSPIFGLSSTVSTTPQQPVFGNSATPSQSLFGNPTPPGFAFGATAPPPSTNGININQQMSMEDSMAEDTYQTNKPSMVQPTFGQQSVSMPQPGFAFGSSAPATPPPSMGNPFQFGVQPSASTPQNASPFQASQSLEFQGGSSFSLGSAGGGGDKSGRRIFKAKKTNRKK